MLRFLLFCSTLQYIYCSCPSGYALTRDGQCTYYRGAFGYYFYDTGDPLKYAIQYCNEKGAHPVSIHSEDQQSYWRAQNGNGYLFLLGLTCNTKSKQWEWQDGSSVDYKPSTYDKELVEECENGCTWMLDRGSGSWYHNCTHTHVNFDFFCIYQLQQPVASTDCGSFDDDSDDSVCYEIAAIAENWKDAQGICHSFGAEVASIHNEQENSYIRRLAVSRGAVNGALIGGITSGKGSDFGWIDGSEWDYTNFHPGFPIDGFGDCLSMDTITTSGQWMNTDCNAKLPVVCARPLYDTPERNGCDPGPWKEGQIIYSPGFPNDASVPCEYFFSVDAGRKVKLQILMLEANSCCDFLMITDGYIGGTVMANLTGEVSGKTYTTSTSNIMRVIWQPNGGVNVRGVVMSYSTA